MSKKNTLFAYFSPKSSPGASSNEKPKKQQNSPLAEPPKARKKIKPSDSGAYEIGDVVWAKLDGYPWWPSLVCEDPGTKVHWQKTSAKNVEIHVQFFDDPPSRSWIREKFVKKFTGVDLENVKKPDAKLKKAFEEAKKASKCSSSERLALVVGRFSKENRTNLDESFELEELRDTDDESERKTPKAPKRKDENRSSGSAKKKRRIVVVATDGDGSDDEYKPVASAEESYGSASEVGADEDEEMSVSEPESVAETPVKKNKKTAKKRSEPFNCSVAPLSSLENTPSRDTERTKAKLSPFRPAQNKTTADESLAGEAKTWAHLTYDFLKNDKIRDAKMRLKSHPEYDPKTLHVPDSAKKTFSPAMKQWWELKSQHFDVVLFFKVGKFYELYHMDAVVGVNELNLIFMKGEFAHSGFPEIAYGRYSASLVERGYKVARVEQMETPVMMEERCKKTSRPTKFDRVVKREICQITTKGTRCYGCLDSQNSEADTAYLLAVTEKSYESASGNESDYGVCFIDTSIGKFHLGQFHDDRHSSRFQTLIAHYVPVQVLYERGTLSAKTLQILKNSLSGALIDPLFPNSEFWSAEKTLKFLAEGKYFDSEEKNAATEWPETLKQMLDDGDSLGLTAKEFWKLAIKSLGACTWYLKDCFLETEFLTMKNFAVYVPIDLALTERPKISAAKRDYFRGKQHMILDSITLKNLDVLQNSSRGTLEGTLLGTLDHCCTLAGKRLLRLWICSPSCNCTAINDRLDALADLMSASEICLKSKEMLKKLPDLERLLSKIHSRGNGLRSKSHPDSRAIFYDDVTYSKRKIMDFIDTLRGFKTALQVIDNFGKHSGRFKSALLKQCVTYENSDGNSGKFPDLTELLDYFDNAFDHETAKKKGSIVPSKGVDPEYDEVVADLDETNQKLQKYLESQCAHFGCKVTYVGSARNRFQLEVPERHVKKATSKYELQGQRKGFKRYWTAEIKELLARVLNAEDRRDAALRDIMRRIFESFSLNYKKWDCAIQCLATLDVLLSLAHYSEFGGSSMCRPSISPPTDDSKPFIEIRNGRHPCIAQVFTGGEFIPNDTFIGTSDGNGGHASAGMLLVTGPNMGGKSTLMRQVGLITILAHMGCYVPADDCRLSPVDRIFTRLGASDRIMQGESTFYVELSETASILHHASEHSLVLMDELGRGTSTYDGISIAYAVVNHLTEAVECRTLFSTHYHSLVGYFSKNLNCALGHMACLVENENEDDPTQETITFLYKFIPGACPKSYGFNAAKLAGLTEDVIRLGHKKAKELEESVENNRIFRSFHRNLIVKDELIRLISAIQI